MYINSSRKRHLRETYDKDMLLNIKSLVFHTVSNEGYRNSKLIYPECVYFSDL